MIGMDTKNISLLFESMRFVFFVQHFPANGHYSVKWFRHLPHQWAVAVYGTGGGLIFQSLTEKSPTKNNARRYLLSALKLSDAEKADMPR